MIGADRTKKKREDEYIALASSIIDTSAFRENLLVTKPYLILHLCLLVLWVSACSSEVSVPVSRGAQAPRGFLDRLSDQLTERECNVVRFTCPYGFGAAGEPCECTDPRGTVLIGRTIK